MRRAEHDDEVRRHFDAVAPLYPGLKRKNPLYHESLRRWVLSRVAPGQRVLDVGCGHGEVLAALRPSEGVGVDLSGAMVARAREERRDPTLRFVEGAIEEFEDPRPFDAAICVNTLEYTHDVGAVLDAIHRSLRDNGRLLVSTANPLWSPVFRAGSRLGLRHADTRRLFVSHADLMNLLELHGFEVVDEVVDLLLPKGPRLLTGVVNWAARQTPGLRLAGSTQLVTARRVPTARRDYSVSIVIPCHDEVGNVERCVAETVALGTHTELIFVDDGSKDGTAAAVRPELNPALDVRVISYSPNRGKGGAVQAGFDAARGEVVIILDADMTTHPSELEPLYEAFATGRAEFVNCTRLVYPMEGEAMRFANLLGNRAFTTLVSRAMGRRVSDTLCGTKAMFREDYRRMQMGRDPWGDYDFLFGAAQLRLVVRELPVHYRERLSGQSKMRALRHTLNLLRMCWLGYWQVNDGRPLAGARPEAAPAPRAPTRPESAT